MSKKIDRDDAVRRAREVVQEIDRLEDRVVALEEALDSARETLYAAGTFASHANDTVREVGYMCLKEFGKIANV